MIQCQSCAANAELFICERCCEEFRADLTRLHQGPQVTLTTSDTEHLAVLEYRTTDRQRSTEGLLADLYDVVVRQTQMGGSGGHRKRGDVLPGPYEPDTEKNKLTAQGTASVLLDLARGCLASIVRDLMDSRGSVCPAETSPAAAAFLAAHVHAMACEESAGIWKREISNLVVRIEKALDRPEPVPFIGPCPIFDTQGNQCRFELHAGREQTHVKCGKCGTILEVKGVITEALRRAGHRLLTLPQIETLLDRIEEPVSGRQLRRWRQKGDLKPRGYWRPDGYRGTMRRSGEDVPGYWLDDARKLRDESVEIGEMA